MGRRYLSGLNNYHSSEFIPGTLHPTQNTPQQCPLGLYAEQLSGSAFTVDRQHNMHVWFYRTLPSVTHIPLKQVNGSSSSSSPSSANSSSSSSSSSSSTVTLAEQSNRLNPTTSESVVGAAGVGLTPWNVTSQFHPPHTVTTPNQLRWDPFELNAAGTN